MNVAPARIYRTGVLWRIFASTVGTTMIGLGLFMIVAITVPLPGIVIRPPIWVGFVIGYSFAIAGIAFGTVIMVGLIKAQVILYPDAIEVAGLFTHRRVNRQDIAAKMVMFVGCTTYVLYPRDIKQRRLNVGVTFLMDESFRNWMSSIPDADRAFFSKSRSK
jgi:hypothetical protein